MTEPEPKRVDSMKDRILIPLKTGLSVGSFVVGLPAMFHLLIVALFWNVAIGYNAYLILIPFIQFLTITIIGSYVVSRSLLSETGFFFRNGKEALGSGILAALAEGVWLLLLGVVIGCIHHLSYFASVQLLQFLLFLFMIIIAIQGCMTWAVFKQSGTSQPTVKTSPDTGYLTLLSRSPYRFFCILLVLVLIVPAGITFGAMRMDLVSPTGSSTHTGLVLYNPPNVSIERTAVDTIVITGTSHETDYCNTNPFIDPKENKNHFIILYNSWDLSDQATIDRQGLSVTIDPPRGLQYNGKSHVVLKGPELINGSSPAHLKIIDVNPSRGSTNMREIVSDKFI